MFRSEKQAKLLRKLIMSSAFSEAEREADRGVVGYGQLLAFSCQCSH